MRRCLPARAVLAVLALACACSEPPATPTAGCACHSSGLNVTTFLRSVQVIEYDATALEQVTDQVLALAIAEDLPAHGRAVTIRRERP